MKNLSENWNKSDSIETFFFFWWVKYESGNKCPREGQGKLVPVSNQSQPEWWWMTAQIFYVHPYISNKIPCFHFFPWRFHKIPVGWANTSMINKFVCQNWLNKEQFFYFVIFLFLLLSLHFPHVSRKVLCTSVVWSFLCSRRICLMYWGIKCPRVWQFHFFFSLTLKVP